MKNIITAVIILGLFSCETEEIEPEKIEQSIEITPFNYEVKINYSQCEGDEDTIRMCAKVNGEFWSIVPPTISVESDSLIDNISLEERYYDEKEYSSNVSINQDQEYPLGLLFADQERYFEYGYLSLKIYYKDSIYLWSRPIKTSVF